MATKSKYGIDLLINKPKHLGNDFMPDHISEMADIIAGKGVVTKIGETVEEIMVAGDRVEGARTTRPSYRRVKHVQ